ncbi:MAG: hypothetical protein KDA60_00685 [Planctomycetales bacterium]|nr:hypothetical protein [Planctomycetales bacterium]
MNRRSLAPPPARLLVVAATLVVGGLFSKAAEACPFCSSVQQTFAEEIASMDVVAFASLIQPGGEPPAGSDELPKSRFRAGELIKGDAWLRVNNEIDVHYFGKPDLSVKYLVMGTDPPSVIWSTPLAMTERSYKYVKEITQLPDDQSRLKFFLKYLEDEDEMLARDSYDEFARAPYADVIGLKPLMDRERLMGWIENKDVPVSRRRLYLTMLGICGTAEDAQALRKYMESDDRQQKAGLDAMIACYLKLVGPQGMELVEKLFLGNPEAEYADTYAAIMAVRFHGNESDDIPRDRLLQGLRLVLDRPQLADLVIPDLARWEDWSVIPKLVELFKNADDDSNWVRVPVVNYMKACPLPEATAQIDKLKEIDPESVKRASVFFPYAQSAQKPRTTDKADGSNDNNDEPAPQKPAE